MASVLGLLNHLRKTFPEYKVRLRRIKLKKDWGYCSRKEDGSFLILLERDASVQVQLDTLIHEYAHVVSWEEDKHPSHHGVPFGVAYSKVYRAYLEWAENGK